MKQLVHNFFVSLKIAADSNKKNVSFCNKPLVTKCLKTNSDGFFAMLPVLYTHNTGSSCET